MLDISIGIVTWNAKSLLEQLLYSLFLHVGCLSCEVIVVDNGSFDGTKDFLRRTNPEVVLVENSINEGVASARNKIFARSKGRYILILDVDTIIYPKAIETLVDVMDQYPEAAIGGPKLVYKDGSLQLSCRPFPSLMNILLEGTFLRNYFPNSSFVKNYTLEDWDHKDMREVDWMYGACLIIRRESLEKIGPFDERFFYLYEDMDLCFRAKKLGFKVMYIPQATVIHFLERERKGIFHPRIGSHVKSIFRYLIKDRYGLLS